MAVWASASVAFREWCQHRVGPLPGTFIGRLAWQVFLGGREMAAAVVVVNEGCCLVLRDDIFFDDCLDQKSKGDLILRVRAGQIVPKTPFILALDAMT